MRLSQLRSALALVCAALAIAPCVLAAPAGNSGSGSGQPFIPPQRPGQSDAAYSNYVEAYRNGAALPRYMEVQGPDESAEKYWERMDERLERVQELAAIAFEQCLRQKVAETPRGARDNPLVIWDLGQECSLSVAAELGVPPRGNVENTIKRAILEEEMRSSEARRNAGGGSSLFQAVTSVRPADVLRQLRAPAGLPFAMAPLPAAVPRQAKPLAFSMGVIRGR